MFAYYNEITNPKLKRRKRGRTQLTFFEAKKWRVIWIKKREGEERWFRASSELLVKVGISSLQREGNKESTLFSFYINVRRSSLGFYFQY